MTIELTADIRSRLDAHMDRVEDALRASGRTREQRRGIVDDLEAQIMDMLAGRSETPTLADLDAVLKALDPPAAYAENATAPAAARVPAPTVVPRPPTPRYSRTAIWGLVLILAGLLPMMLSVVLLAFIQVPSPGPGISNPPLPPGYVESPRVVMVDPTSPASPRIRSWGFTLLPCLGLAVLPLGLAGTVLGWIAFFQIRASARVLRGTGLALFDGLFYPILFCGLLMLRVTSGSF